MGSLTFYANKGRVVVEMHAEGDPCHDGCDGGSCHWQPDSFETQYLDLDAAKKLRASLDEAILRAELSMPHARR